MGEFAFTALRSEGLLVPLLTAEGQGQAFETRLHGQRLGWIVTTWGSVDGPRFAPGFDSENGRLAIRVALWSILGPNLTYREPSMRPAELGQDDVGTAEPSSLADDLARTMKPGGAVLLHGLPGTGKSCAARRVADLLGGLRLRVQARDLSAARHLAGVVALMQPTVVLVDDLDRVPNENGSTIDTIDAVKAAAKVVIATANDVTKLDPALLRPGRFDEVREVEGLDPEALQRVLDRVPAHLRSPRLEALPVAYIAHFAVRHRDRDPDALLDELEERARLAARATQPQPDPIPKAPS